MARVEFERALETGLGGVHLAELHVVYAEHEGAFSRARICQNLQMSGGFVETLAGDQLSGQH